MAPPQLPRRRALQLFAGLGLALVGCGSSGDGDAGSASSTTASTTGSSAGGSADTGTAAAASCDTIPEETAGPFPGDGSNGPDALSADGIVRDDLTASLGGGATAEGVPLTVRLALVDTASGCAPMPGAAVYAWHCDREGRYSMYSDGVEDVTYLRGVQAAGDDGTVQFTTVFPGAYPGRWPHIHFEVYEDVDAATGGGSPIATSQLALPEDACNEVYATDGYEASVGNLAQLSLASDNVFGDDGGVHQLATMSGTTAGGLTADLQVPV
jgi:protocatechuate 3,4-dioxygenase beta subunit